MVLNEKDIISAHITDATIVSTTDLVDDGGAYNAAWCDTVVTMCNEIKSDYNLAKTAINAILAALEAQGILRLT